MYLVKRRNVWFVRWIVPADLRERFGKREVWITTRTDSKSVAALRAAPIVAKLKAEAREYRGQAGSIDAEALWWRDALRKTDPDHIGEAREHLLKVVADRYLPKGARQLAMYSDEEPVEVVLGLGGDKVRRFLDVALGTDVPLAATLDAFMTHRRTAVEARTADADRVQIEEWCRQFPTARSVTKEAVVAWRDRALLTLTPATVKRKLGPVRAYWRWLKERGEVDTDPFAGLSFKARSKTTVERAAFDPADVAKLYAAAVERKDTELADVIAIGSYSGARLEEIASLRVEDVVDGVIRITDAKTKAGNRVVPIHPRLKATITRLVAGRSTGRLFAKFKPTRHGDYGNAVGHRFSRLKRRLGFPLSLVFHSIRHCVATQMKRANIPESTAAEVLGHEWRTMSFGVYGGGTTLEQRLEAVAKITYPAPL